jgi:UDP-perosamine 4-acetyltransferase
MGFELVNAIDPAARVSPKAKLGKGGLVATGAIIALHTVLGDNVYLGPGAVISHDVTVGNNALLSVGCVVAARVDIADEAFVGAGARIVPAAMGQNVRLRVGVNTVVGAGAVVLGDVPDHAVVVGVPARVIRYRQPQGAPA